MNKMTKEWGYKHDWQGVFELSADAAASARTCMPLIVGDTGLGDPTNIKVNPNSPSVTTKADHGHCFLGSVVNKIFMDWRISFTVAGQEAGIYGLILRKMMTCLSFEDIDKTNVSGTSVATILGLTKTANFVRPTWSGTDLPAASTLSTVETGLTGGQIMESVTQTPDTVEDELWNKSLSGLLKTLTFGGYKETIIRREFPIIDRQWYEVHPKTKRINKQTFCGLFLDLPQAGSNEQFQTGAELTSIGHIRFNYRIRFTEYNDAFDQS